MDQAEDRLAQAVRLVREGEGHVVSHRALINSLEKADRRIEASLARDEFTLLAWEITVMSAKEREIEQSAATSSCTDSL